MTQLNADNLTITATSDGQLSIEPQYVDYLRSHGYKIEAVPEAHAVPSESGDGMHFVCRIVTHTKPFADPTLDLTADTVDVWVCDCGAFRYQQSADVSKDGVTPDDSGHCKHVTACSKVARAKADDSQATLERGP